MQATRADAAVAPEVEARVQELLRGSYRMVIRGDPEEGYLAEAPELPGCVTAGDTPEEAMALLRDAMHGWLVVAVERGDQIPEPTVEPSRGYSGKFVLRVPKSLHQHLAERAAEEGVSLNQLALTYLSLGVGGNPLRTPTLETVPSTAPEAASPPHPTELMILAVRDDLRAREAKAAKMKEAEALLAFAEANLRQAREGEVK